MNNERTTDEQRVNTPKELKKVKNVNNEKKEISSEVKKFQPPQLLEVMEYFNQNGGSDDDAEKFHNHFTSNGWLVSGKAKMKDWQASARNWIKNSKIWNKENGQPKPSNRPATSDEIIKHFSQPITNIKLGDFSDIVIPKDSGNS